MKKSDFPTTVKRRDYYNPTEVAIILGVSIRTAHAMIDDGRIRGAYRAPGGRRERYVRHAALMEDHYNAMVGRVEGLTQEEREIR